MLDFAVLASGCCSQRGVTRNPRHRRFNSSGSSSRAAAAVAAEIDVAAIGTDSVGSVRLPASFCGRLELIPSQGRVPSYRSNNPALASGSLTRSVEDTAILLNLMTLPDAVCTSFEYRRCDYLAALKQRLWPKHELALHAAGALACRPAMRPSARSHVLHSCWSARHVARKRSSFRSIRLISLYYKTRRCTEVAAPPAEKSAAAAPSREWTASLGMHAACDFFDAISSMRRLWKRLHSAFTSIDYLVLPSVHIALFAAELPAPDSESPFEPRANTFLFNLTEQPSAVRRDGEQAAGRDSNRRAPLRRCWRAATITCTGAIARPARKSGKGRFDS